MSGVSYLSPATVSTIRQAALNGHATKSALLGTESLVLARWNATLERYDTLPAQAVVVTYANRAEQEARGDAARATLVDGYFDREEPFDVEAGDRFALGQMLGEIVVVLPPQLGVQRADWALRLGEAS